jgi:tungstate transport system substrate-binding protein
VRLLPGPARELLSALGRGEHDGALLNTPLAEAELERLGLLRDRRQIASVDFVIVGPSALRAAIDALQARAQAVRAAAELVRIGAPFVGATAGSGTAELEAVLWRAARVAPQAPWYRSPSGPDPLTSARAGAACALVERGVWVAAAPALRATRDYGILVDGDPLLRVPVHAMRSFHGDHPAGKLWMNWLASAPGRRAITTLPAYRATSP